MNKPRTFYVEVPTLPVEATSPEEAVHKARAYLENKGAPLKMVVEDLLTGESSVHIRMPVPGDSSVVHAVDREDS